MTPTSRTSAMTGTVIDPEPVVSNMNDLPHAFM